VLSDFRSDDRLLYGCRTHPTCPRIKSAFSTSGLASSKKAAITIKREGGVGEVGKLGSEDLLRATRGAIPRGAFGMSCG
jgi:hypothetical protein